MKKYGFLIFWLVLFSVFIGGGILIVVNTDTPQKRIPHYITLNVEDKTYDGKPIEVNASSSSGETPILKYKFKGTSNASLTLTQPKDAGEYIVVASVGATEKYKEETSLAYFTIFPKEVTLSWTAPNNLIYDGTKKIPTLKVDGIVNNDNCIVTTTLASGKDNLNAGSFTYLATSISNNNYKLPYNIQSPIYTITKANYNMENAKWNYTTPFDYDGTIKTVTVSGLPEGVTVKGYTNNENSLVGKYIASVEFDYDERNYNKPTLPDLNWQITSKNLVLEFNQTSKNYLGDKLSSVKITCNDPSATLEWVNPSQTLTSTTGSYQLKYISNDGERIEIVNVQVVALDPNAPKQDTFVQDDMLFTLNHSKLTASVKANTDTLTKAIIPEKVYCNSSYYTVTTLEYHAFYDIDTLTEVFIPKTITNYLGAPFSHCKNLTKARFDENLTKLGSQMFMYCDSLSDVILPKTITTLPSGLFYSCKSLTSITIPSSVTKIENSCFYNTSLSEIKLPSSLTLIGNYAFFNCLLENLTIPASVTSLGSNTFSQNENLTKLEILSQNLTIGAECFKHCSILREVYINSQSLLNSLSSDTSDTHYLLAYLENDDILYVKNTITNISSTYFNSTFIKTTSNVTGYNAYKFGEYTIIKANNVNNRIYTKNSGLFGDETITVKTPSGKEETIKLTSSMLSGFNTTSTGKKLATISYNYKTITFEYYVLNSLSDTSLNCISSVNNLLQNYELGDNLLITTPSLTYVYVDQGYMKKTSVGITKSMVSGFDTSSTGSKIMTINYNSCQYKIPYNVQDKFTENVTSESFVGGKYYSENTTEYTTHFVINIKKGSYLYSGYKEMIEIIYAIQQEVSGLKFADTITIDVDDTNYPSCGGTTLYLTSSNLFLTSSSTFCHELAHALDHSQSSKSLSNSVLTEGFASYIEYLTARKLFELYPETYAYNDSYIGAIHSYFDTEAYSYDYEETLLRLGRDELAANSQYEVGARLFSYFHHRYGDFCSWMKGNDYRVTLDSWISLMKTYYNNQNLFSDIHKYIQSFGDKYYSYLGVSEYNQVTSYNDLTSIHKYDYFFDFSVLKQYWGNQSFFYKDLYVNIDCARDQLTKSKIEFSELSLKTSKNVTIELYNSSGTLIRTVTNTTTAFSLSGVSFIKFVGIDYCSVSLTY